MFPLHTSSVDGCDKVLREGFDKCFAHGGYNACYEEGCNKLIIENNRCALHNKQRLDIELLCHNS